MNLPSNPVEVDPTASAGVETEELAAPVARECSQQRE